MQDTTMSKAERAQVILYTAELSGLDTTVARPVKVWREMLGKAYLKAKDGKPAYNGQSRDIADLFHILEWPLPTAPKAKPAMPTAQQVIDAAAQVAKRNAAPKTTPALTYRELQAQCKALGLKASGKRAELEARLTGLGTVTVELNPTPSPESGVRSSKRDTKADHGAIVAPKARKSKSRTHHGLTYREAQQCVTYLRTNCCGFAGAELARNIGWDNVAANLDSLMAQPGWGYKFSPAHVKECPALAKLGK